jgi:dUTP pyrophosphatase
VLKVKLLSDSAKLPTLAHPGEDLGYDLYTDRSGILPAKGMLVLTTGVAAEYTLTSEPELRFGFLVKIRSSLGMRGVVILGGVIDAGYRGEVKLMLGSFADEDIPFHAGDKIANLIPIPVVATSNIQIASDLSLSLRGEKWNGSSGR